MPIQTQWLGRVDYMPAWDQQRAHAATRAAGAGDDLVMLLEHPPVYTAGRRTEPHERPTDGTPVVDVDRGGKITWHGPGQLVGYPIVALRRPYDVVNYVRRLEQALIMMVSSFGLRCGRVAGRTGVWLPADDRGPERKIAAIGVRVTRGVTLHGFALNCNPDLRAFDLIVPCGITDAGVTSLSVELDRPVSVEELVPLATDAVPAALDGLIEVRYDEMDHQAAAPAGPTMALDPAMRGR